MSSPKVFRGEGDAMVDALVEACKAQNRPSLEAPSLPHLIGRELTPYFGSSEPVQAGKNAANNKRKGASPKQMRPKPTTSPVSSPNASPPSRTAHVPAMASTPSTDPQNKPKNKGSRPSKNPKTPEGPSIAYACPAMFMSPKPETLPLPSTGLLRNAIRPMALVAA